MSSIEEELVAIRGKTLNTTREERAKFETTRRLLASLANECLVHSTILKPSKVDDGSPLWLCLSERAPDPESRHRRCTRTSTSNCSRIWVALSSADIKSADDLEMKKDAVITSHGVLDPEDLVPPVIVEVDTSSPDSTNRRRVELNPGVLFGLMYPWFGDDHEPDGIRDQIIEELEDSAANQGLFTTQHFIRLYMHILTKSVSTERWFEAAQKTPPPELHSPSIKWEIAMIRGHPTHPVSSKNYFSWALFCRWAC
jgi:hypothetical protein